jgi:hypothetical protein
MPYTNLPALTGSPFSIQTKAAVALWPYYDATGAEIGTKIVLAQNTPHNTSPNTPIAALTVADTIAAIASDDPALVWIPCVLADGRLVWVESEAPFLVYFDPGPSISRAYLPVGVVGPNYVLSIALIADSVIERASVRGVLGKKDLARFKAGAAPITWAEARARGRVGRPRVVPPA